MGGRKSVLDKSPWFGPAATIQNFVGATPTVLPFFDIFFDDSDKKIIILIHGVFATLCTFLICTRLKINNFISAVCAISFALSSSNINYLHVDDWPFAFISYSMLPIMLLLLLNLQLEGFSKKLANSILLGFCGGIFLATGLFAYLIHMFGVLCLYGVLN